MVIGSHDSPRHEHLDRLEAVAQLAGGVSRDIGHLIEVALAGVRTAHVDQRVPAEVAVALDEAREALLRAQGLTRQLAAFGRLEPARSGPVALDQVVAKLRPVMLRLSGPYIELVEGPAAPEARVLADDREVEQLLLHLVVNARDAMPLGGRLGLSVDVRDLVEPMPHAFGILAPGRWSVLEVRDSGTGIDADVLAHLFEPYFTTKGPGLGSGLGLATVYGIARRAGGQVVVESTVGAGTTVAVWLPWHQPAGVQHPSGPAAVLVVDADPWTRTIAGRALRREGYGVLEAERGSDALALLHDVAGQHVGVVLTNGTTPGGDGSALAALLRRERPDLRVIALTAPAEAVTGRASTRAGLQAPFSREAVLAAVAAA